MAKDVKCINAKTYALRVGREYEAEEIPNNNNYYYIINNNGIRAKYASNLFEDVVVEVIPDTLQDIKETVRIETVFRNNYQDQRTVSTTRLTIDGNHIEFSNEFTLKEASNSCGIYNANGLDELMNAVCRYVPVKEDLQKFVLNAIMTSVRDNNRVTGIITYTTNNHNELFDNLELVMDNLSASKAVGINPIHNSTITLWTFVYGIN